MDITYAKERRNFLVTELEILKAKAQSFDISGNRKYYARGTIKKDIFDAYKNNSKLILSTEKEIRKINDEIRKITDLGNNEKEVLKLLIKECLSEEDFNNLWEEFKRRVTGNESIKVTFNKKDNSKYLERVSDLKKALENSITKLITAREGINNYILENEPEINKGDYLISVSNLNKCCPPLNEINNMKKIIYK